MLRFQINADKNADYDVTVQGVEISPYPVVRGSPATFSISANTGSIESLCDLLDVISICTFLITSLFFSSFDSTLLLYC